MRSSVTMMGRKDKTTFEALEKNTNRVVVLKVVKNTLCNEAFHHAMKQILTYEFRYLVRYLNFYEKENECQVMIMRFV